MTRTEEVARIVASTATISDKIRALDAAGFPRAEIARLLGKRYQHVRNVLEGDKVGHTSGQPTGMAEEPVVFDHNTPQGFLPADMPIRLEVGPGGRVYLPPNVLEALGAREGSVIIGRQEGDTLKMMSAKEAVRQVKAFFRSLVPEGGPGLADELIADRRREAERDEREG